jgi:lipopolysaccharide/colanic/teichoic acid biosynthesis glycosyltransferase
MLKRFFDIVLSTVGLIITAPVFLLLAAVIKSESSGPVFYRGVRVGLYGRPFRIFKFRTMVVNAEKMGCFSTADGDPRITRTGKIIRKYKLDELPQLINLLVGDMSFVGPRPEVQKFVDMYTPEEKIILTVRPGITDWSSIKFYNEGEIIASSGIADADEAYFKLIRPEKLRLQMKYVRESALLIDIKIILATFATLIAVKSDDNPIEPIELPDLNYLP